MKKTILIFADFYLPGYLAGGPIRSIANLVNWLGDFYNFKIITSHTDYTKTEPYQNIEINAWNKVGRADVFYFDGKITNYLLLKNVIAELKFDLVLFNSFFSVKYTILPFSILRLWNLADREQIIVISRGEFSSEALRIKEKKKKVYLFFIKMMGLFDEINWCFTNENEEAEFYENIDLPNKSVNILPNLPKKIDKNIQINVIKKENSIRIIYLSRIASIKNLDYALKVLKKVEKTEVVFDIYGIKDDLGYWKKCQAIIATLPGNINVRYKGHIENERVIETIAGYHLFILPTKSENFGHAIYEAMLAGTPVLISDQTPWRNLQSQGLGWDLPLRNMQDFLAPIKKIAAMNQSEMYNYKNSVRYVIQQEKIQQSVNSNKAVLDKLIDKNH